MKQKVYVVFHDHEDYMRPDIEWNADYVDDYNGVYGTWDEARGYIQNIALSDYYEYLDEFAFEEVVADFYDDPEYFPCIDAEYDVLEDEGSKMVYVYNGNTETWRIKEVEITV